MPPSPDAMLTIAQAGEPSGLAVHASDVVSGAAAVPAAADAFKAGGAVAQEDLPLAARREGRHQPKKKWESPEQPLRVHTAKRMGKRVQAARPSLAAS